MKEKIITEYNERFNGAGPEETLRFFLDEFKDRICFASSMGLEDQVITHMIAHIDRQADIFTLDTGRLFPETYDLIDKTSSRYGIRVRIMFPDRERVEEMVNSKGVNLFYESIENRKLCCHIRKTEPLRRALAGKEAWITGLRRTQSVTRKNLELVSWDEGNGLIKINPLIDWTEEMVWDYIKKNNIPYNALHNKGFPSLGCQPCTRAVKPGEDIRAGRWWWELPEQKECGLHVKRD